MLNLSRSKSFWLAPYIEEPPRRIMADYEKVMARIRRGNPPEFLPSSRFPAQASAEMEKRRLANRGGPRARLMADKVYGETNCGARLWTSFCSKPIAGAGRFTCPESHLFSGVALPPFTNLAS